MMKKNYIYQLFVAIVGVYGCCAYASNLNLPAPLEKAYARTGLPDGALGLWIAAAGSREPVFAVNADQLMRPASVIKVVTTLAGLDILTPSYRWYTSFSAQSKPNAKGEIKGFTITGGGDPHYVIERVWLMAERLSEMGVRRIVGDIGIDRTLFAERITMRDQGAFDGAATRTYNVGPDAFLVNFKAVSVHFAPDTSAARADISVMPRLQGVSFPRSVPLSKGPCTDYRKSLKARFHGDGRVEFKGSYPAACGSKTWHVSRWGEETYLTRLLGHVFSKVGIEWRGSTIPVSTHAAHVLFTEESEPLSQITTYINKFSNNPMARHLFLTLSLTDPEAATGPATYDRSRQVLRNWMTAKDITNPQSVYLDNGSGLSRDAKASPRALGEILSYGWRSRVMPEYVASFPMAGVDGTMSKRGLRTGSAHIKTGYLANARSIAGYVTDVNGQRWVVVAMINAEKIQHDKAFLDEVLNWCGSGMKIQTIKQ